MRGTKQGERHEQFTRCGRRCDFSSTKESEDQLAYKKDSGSSPYVARASYLPIYNYGGEFTHNDLLDYDLMRRNFNEWKSVRHLLTKDMYVLTPWRHHSDRRHWTAFAYDDEETGEGVLPAFRMEEADSDRFVAKLPFARDGAVYRLKNADTNETFVYDAEKGVTVTLKEKKTSALFYIKKDV